jgi:hypothetical protein
MTSPSARGERAAGSGAITNGAGSLAADAERLEPAAPAIPGDMAAIELSTITTEPQLLMRARLTTTRSVTTGPA